MKWHLLHPAFVHYPIALLSIGLAAGICARLKGAPAWLAEAASWLLWLGTASAWAALGLGLLAERTARHVPPAWEALADHKTLAYWTAGSFSALSVWRWSRRFPLIQLAAWIAATGLLFATAYEGGEVVFRYGMGVGR